MRSRGAQRTGAAAASPHYSLFAQPVNISMAEPLFLTRVATESDAEGIALVTWNAFQVMMSRLRPLALDDKPGFLHDAVRSHLLHRIMIQNSCFFQAQRARNGIAGGQGPQMKWYVVVPASEPETIAVIARWERVENACEKPFEPSPTAAWGGPLQVDFFNKLHLAHRENMGSRPHYSKLSMASTALEYVVNGSYSVSTAPPGDRPSVSRARGGFHSFAISYRDGGCRRVACLCRGCPWERRGLSTLRLEKGSRTYCPSCTP